MGELTITRIKYPKNDTIEYEYESLDNLLMELKQMIIDKKVNKDDIIRIRGEIIMNKEEIKIKEFDKEQLELLLKDLQDIDKFTGFKDGAFKYELGKYQANLLVNCIKKYKEVINKAIEFTNKNWGTWCTHHLEYMTELQNILKEVSE